MKRFGLIFALLIYSSLVWATTITANTSVTKNLSDTTAWVGGVAPRCTGLDNIIIPSSSTITVDSGAALASTLTLTQVALSLPNVTYSYSSYTGTIPVPGTTLTFSGFVNTGNNITAPISAISGGASGTITVYYPPSLFLTNPSNPPTAETHAGSATGSYCALGTSGASTVGSVQSVANPSGSSFSGTCSVAFTSGGGIGAAATCSISAGSITTVLTKGGDFYTSAPTATYTCTGCSSTTSPSVVVNSGGTAAVSAAGVIKVATGVSLLARGDVLTNLSSGSVAWFVLNAGSYFAFDSSQSTTPSITRYIMGQSQNISYRWVDTTACTSSQPCVFTSVTANSALPGVITGFGYSGGGTFGGGLKASYTAFSFIGDATLGATSQANGSPSVPWSSIHNTWDNCGVSGYGNYVGLSGGTAGQNTLVQHDYNIHTNSLGATPFGVSFSTTLGSSTREIVGNIFDTMVSENNYPNLPAHEGVTLTGNYFAQGLDTANGNYKWTSFSDNLYRNTSYAATGFSAIGDMSNSYWTWDFTGVTNPHSIGPNGYYSTTFNNLMFDVTDVRIGDSGENVLIGSPYTTTNLVENSISLPDAAGKGHSEFTSKLDGLATALYNFQHDTWFAAPGFGMVDVNETAQTPAATITLQNNLLFSPTSVAALKVQTTNTTSITYPNPCNTTTCNYNNAWNLASTLLSCNTSTVCLNQGNGYGASFTATPGPNDLAVNPGLVDYQRTLPLWDTKYLKHTASQWVNSNTYAYGAMVSDSNASIYWGLTVNYRCLNLSGCGNVNGSEPGVFVQTLSLTTSSASGSPVNITVASSTGFYIGNTVYIQAGNGGTGNPESQTITNVPDGTHITVGMLTYTHSTNTLINNTTWRNYWEYASYFWLRSYIAQQTTFTDSTIGVSGADALTTMMAWIKKGYGFTNVALHNAGSDGLDIGAGAYVPASTGCAGCVMQMTLP